MDRICNASGVLGFGINIFQNGRLITEAFQQPYNAEVAYRRSITTDSQYFITIFKVEARMVARERKANQIDK